MISRILSEVAAAGAPELVAYAMGALRDGTFSGIHRTWRLAQAHVAWLEVVQVILLGVGANSWIYREGGRRSVWVLETCFRPDGLRPDFLVPAAVDRAYARGYFDAEGGIPRDPTSRFYVQLTQKDHEILRNFVGVSRDLD
ncbi:MAG: LAGLIDADG family homing endonuclease [Actinomycetota bacterium]